MLIKLWPTNCTDLHNERNKNLERTGAVGGCNTALRPSLRRRSSRRLWASYLQQITPETPRVWDNPLAPTPPSGVQRGGPTWRAGRPTAANAGGAAAPALLRCCTARLVRKAVGLRRGAEPCGAATGRPRGCWAAGGEDGGEARERLGGPSCFSSRPWALAARPSARCGRRPDLPCPAGPTAPVPGEKLSLGAGNGALLPWRGQEGPVLAAPQHRDIAACFPQQHLRSPPQRQVEGTCLAPLLVALRCSNRRCAVSGLWIRSHGGGRAFLPTNGHCCIGLENKSTASR